MGLVWEVRESSDEKLPITAMQHMALPSMTAVLEDDKGAEKFLSPRDTAIAVTVHHTRVCGDAGANKSTGLSVTEILCNMLTLDNKRPCYYTCYFGAYSFYL